ncbi:acylneuraminate cytidylyltransferase family protein [Fulvivirga ulvae]|uniref:acylneuraminate cytidylyltransferase family protein n=1 Tax=Fulvivirga ulvae TaxID=2904245 RepID=UPI001F3CDDD6|nr:acylneuraminate cytidylyltransferase family protein [Fulvivirga ulvae]UII31654.1 acylneuraminate cytidylyltransferase family protein [Fulvivirga ulvae]
MKSIAIIPARGGSKGVRRKNIRQVAGSPLISYAIDCARDSKKITDFIVDTDDAEIAEVCKQLDAEVLMRPPELAQDTSSVVDVAINTIKQLSEKGRTYDIVVLLQPTAPIRTGKNLDDIIDLFERDVDQAVEGVVSVIEQSDVHPARMYTLENLNMIALNPKLEHKRRQDLYPVYFRNGCFYAVRRDVLLYKQTFMPEQKKAYVMPAEWLANVDNDRDLLIADTLVKAWKDGVV